MYCVCLTVYCMYSLNCERLYLLARASISVGMATQTNKSKQASADGSILAVPNL